MTNTVHKQHNFASMLIVKYSTIYTTRTEGSHVHIHNVYIYYVTPQCIFTTTTVVHMLYTFR